MKKTKQYPALFATNTIDGPRDLAHLAELLKACGMSAAAWLIESAQHAAEDAEERIYTEAEVDEMREEAERDKRAALEEYEPYKQFFEDVVSSLEEHNGRWPYAAPNDGDLLKVIAEDLELAAEVRELTGVTNRKA